MNIKIKQQIQKTIECLKNDGVIICPSGSCYSLSCDAKSENKENLTPRDNKKRTNRSIDIIC